MCIRLSAVWGPGCLEKAWTFGPDSGHVGAWPTNRRHLRHALSRPSIDSPLVPVGPRFGERYRYKERTSSSPSLSFVLGGTSIRFPFVATFLRSVSLSFTRLDSTSTPVSRSLALPPSRRRQSHSVRSVRLSRVSTPCTSSSVPRNTIPPSSTPPGGIQSSSAHGSPWREPSSPRGPSSPFSWG